MRRTTVEMEPADAARQAMIALLEAATYSGHGVRTAGRRAGSKAAVVGAEGARRAGGAAQVLRGGVPAQPTYTGRILLAATAGGTVGALAALAISRGLAARRTGTNGTSTVYPETAAADSPGIEADAASS